MECKKNKGMVLAVSKISISKAALLCGQSSPSEITAVCEASMYTALLTVS